MSLRTYIYFFYHRKQNDRIKHSITKQEGSEAIEVKQSYCDLITQKQTWTQLEQTQTKPDLTMIQTWSNKK